MKVVVFVLVSVAAFAVSDSRVFAQPQADTAVSQQSQRVSLDQVPAAVRQQFKKLEPVGSLQDVSMRMRGGEPVYDAVFKKPNSETEFSVMQTGQPLSLRISGTGRPIAEAAGAQRAVAFTPSAPVPVAIRASDLPQAVLNTLQQQLGRVQITSAQSGPLYDIVVLNDQGRQQKVRIAADGTLLDFQQMGTARPTSSQSQAQP